MESALEQLVDLADLVRHRLPRAADLTALSPAEETEAMRMLAGIRNTVAEPISLLAADIQRKSDRALGTSGLAQQRGFKDGLGLIQDLTGSDRADAARLIRLGGIREDAATLTPHLPTTTVPAPPPSATDGDGAGTGTGTGTDNSGIPVTTTLAIPPERTIDAL